VLLANHFALLPQWRGSEDAPETPEARPETLLVWRRDLDVFHRAIDAEEAECLERVGGGIAFAELCARLAIGRTDEVAAVRAFELVARWAADGLLCEPAADGRLCEPD